MTVVPVYTPSLQQIILCAESTRGTASSAAGLMEACMSATSKTNGNAYVLDAYTGTTVSKIDIQPTARWSDISISTPFRAAGVVPYVVCSMLGTGSDNKTGAGPSYTHTMTPQMHNVVGKTYTIYHDRGDGSGSNNVSQMKRGTFTSLHFTASPDAALTCDVSAIAEKEALVALPTISTWSTDEMTMGYEGTVTIYNSSNVAYTANITAADFTLTRPADPLATIQQLSIKDITPGSLMLDGSVNFQYDGNAAGTIYSDWLNMPEQAGDGTHKCSIAFTDENSHSITITFWPFRIADMDVAPNGNYMEGTLTFGMYNKATSVLQASPVGTSPESIVVVNTVATALG